MKIWPLLIDSRPEYLGRSPHTESLLGMPMGRARLVSELTRQIQRITTEAPTIVSPRGASDAYVSQMAALCPTARVATSGLAEILVAAETSDFLLFLDARYLTFDDAQLTALVTGMADNAEMARHLVAYAADIAGTRENVSVDGHGDVRSVHRYYKPATWPFIAGVAASVVPMASGVLSLMSVPTSLLELRQVLVSSGVPSRDIAVSGGVFDLSADHGLMAAMERSVRDAAAVDAGGTGGPVLAGHGHLIDPTARLLGPVILQGGARVEANATVVGPALIGEHATVSSGAVVAHACVGAGAIVSPDQVLRDRSWIHIDRPAPWAPAPSFAATVPSFTERLARHGVEIAELDTLSTSTGGQTRFYPVVKRAADAVIAAVALVLLAPLLALIAALVRLDSRGSVFFRHTREGVGGELFECLKFRTMRVGADHLQRQLKSQDKLDGPHFKLDSDPRITRVGRWLRATNFDELPQLVNVLMGDMSLVGPRPSPFRENQICVPWRTGRLSVRPGITGLWQVCRQDRAAGDFHQWIEYDLLYVQHLAPLLDLKVLLATVATLGGKFPVPVSWLLPHPRSGPRPESLARTASARESRLAHAKRPASSTQ